MTDRCRVILHTDGSIETNHPAPGVSTEQAWARLLEIDAHPSNPSPSGYAKARYFDLDESDLPPAALPCATCGESHDAFDLLKAKGDRLVIDPSRPNLSAAFRHLAIRRDAEIAKGAAMDAVTVYRLDRLLSRGREWFGLSVKARGPAVREIDALLAELGDG